MALRPWRSHANTTPGKMYVRSVGGSNNLPEWFGIRAEFELNVLLFQQGGEENITYRDFLLDQSKHFADYAAHPRGYDLRGLCHRGPKLSRYFDPRGDRALSRSKTAKRCRCPRLEHPQ